MKSILVTGANGFVGSHILQSLQSTPDVKVVAACRNKNKLPKGLDCEVREGDLRDIGYVRELLNGIDVVCHAAAWSSLWKHARETRELYYQPSIHLLNECVEQNVSRVLFISTTSAAAPEHSDDATSQGTKRDFWPHLGTIIGIEDTMRKLAQHSQTTMVVLRCGIFAGERYGLGVLPILLPRLKTHLVPWIVGGRTSLPIIDGADIGEAFKQAAIHPDLKGYEAFNIVGPEIPTYREVLTFLNEEFGYPTPHFSVPFPVAYAFAWLMEKLDPFVPWDPLVTRSIVHLVEEVGVTNSRAEARLGYKPKVHWKTAVRKQLKEMAIRQTSNMSMTVPLS